MSESEDGVSVSCTRQKGGRFFCSMNVPLVTASADVTFALVSFSDAASCSQVAASARAGARNRHETNAMVFMVQSL